jgi:hypothetical protein
MGETIWASGLFQDTTLLRGFWDRNLGDPPESKSNPEVGSNPRLARECRVNEGEVFAPAELPSKFYKVTREDEYVGDPQFHSLPKAFSSQYAFVNEEIAALMRDFDLADHALHPVELYLHKCETPIEKQYYLLNFGVQKKTIDRANCVIDTKGARIKQRPAIKPLYRFPLGSLMKGNKYFFYQGASDGKDLWVDPEIDRAFFVSDRLRATLKKAKFDGFLQLSPIGPS